MSARFWTRLLNLDTKRSQLKRPVRRLRVESLEERAVPAAPVIDPIADRALSSNQTVIQVPVVASDADGDPLTYSVRSAGSEAYFVATDLQLKASTRPNNWGGSGEKWFASTNGWYFILSNGDLFRWDGANKQASGERVASVEPVYFYYPDLLTKPRDQNFGYVLDQKLGLTTINKPAQNTLGLQERWLAGFGGSRFIITPDGDLFRAGGKPLGTTWTLLAHLDSAYYQNTDLLTKAQNRPLNVSLRGSVLQIDEVAGAGSYAVQVKAKDGTSTVQQLFQVRAAGPAVPVIPEVSPQVLGVGEETLSVPLNATDADGDTITYTVKVSGSEAFFLDGDLELNAFNRATNWGGENEKWLQGKNGTFYFLKPSGEFYRWDATPNVASGELLATLAPVYYFYLDMLTKPKDQDLAFAIDQRLGLMPTAVPAPNALGLQEKWLAASTSDAKFFITPEGGLYRQFQNNIAWLGDIGAGFHKQPARLYGAARDRFSASVDANGLLTVTTKPNYMGQFVVQVTASDGTNKSSRVIPFTQSDYVSPGAPHVVGAISSSNRTMVVTFTQPMSTAATNPANYQVTQQNAASAAAGLRIVSARFMSPDRTTVELTTLSQSEVGYRVAVVNVKDLGGVPLAPVIVTNGILVNPNQAEFVGTPPSAADLADTDGDGLPDHEEQRGWDVQVKMLNGTTSTRWVTSDPRVADTDADGLSDAQEVNIRLDPRDRDSDDDQLNDYQEFNEIYSDPVNQDSDGDTLDDSLEFNFFRSSPVQKDTDGDQNDDNHEIVLGNRDVRIADLPKPGIEVGSVGLSLDVRFTATSATGTRTLDSQKVESSLAQTDSKKFSNTDADSQQFATKVSYETSWKAGVDFGAAGKFKAEAGYTGQWTSSFTEETAKETQSAVSKSFASENEATQQETVQREVVGASMKVSVMIKTLSNVAFTVKNVQVTAFFQDPNNPARLIPIATLIPDAGVPNEFTVGPLIPERGPFIFTNDQIYPSLVQSLMLNPRGLVFKVSNYDMTDESGRQFAFTSQSIVDRTGALVLDFGGGEPNGNGAGGTTERYRVATSAGRIAVDTNGDGSVNSSDRPVVFDPNTGESVGITIRDAMERVLGLTRYNEAATPSSSLTQLQLEDSYSTKVINGVERLWRVRDISQDLTNPLKKWTVFTANGIDVTTNFSDLVLETESGLTFKFLQDLDNDGIEAGQEYVLGSSDTKLDTDADGLSDAFEFFGRGPDPSDSTKTLTWTVDVVGKETRLVFSSPARADSDLDGVNDQNEFDRFVDIDTDGDGTADLFAVRKSTDPRSPDTDGDGVSDKDEIIGYSIDLRFALADGSTTITRMSDPLNPDTDGDTLPDGDERTLGTDPTLDDANQVLDDDGDGLVNFVEDEGWNVTKYALSTTAGTQGTATTYAVTSSKTKADTDNDGLSDKEELALGTDPNVADTDFDGVNDVAEVTIVVNPDLTRTITLKYNPLDTDMDNDKRSDGAELQTPITVTVVGQTPYDVFSNPKDADADRDLLVDGDEATQLTDPTKFDTDGDNAGIGDAREIAIGTNPNRKDQKVSFTVTQVQLTGDVSDGVGDDTLDIHGVIFLGKTGNMQAVKTYSGTGFNSGTIDTLNLVREFVLIEGESLTLQMSSFYDYDASSGNDVFSPSEKSFSFQISAASGSIAAAGDSATGDGVNLTTSYTIGIVS